MSRFWVTAIPPALSRGSLKKIYDRVRSPNGQVDRVYQAQSLRPETILGHERLYRSILHIKNPACPPWFLEAIAVYTSVLNRCPYAVLHHYANMKHLLGNEKQASAILRAFEADSLERVFSNKERHLLLYARKLTLAPTDMQAHDVDQLRDHGARDEEILEVNQVTAGFNYSNRVINGLGVTPGNEKVGYYDAD
jgi:uncharacterized peroxidase-related enzyme